MQAMVDYVDNKELEWKDMKLTASVLEDIVAR